MNPTYCFVVISSCILLYCLLSEPIDRFLKIFLKDECNHNYKEVLRTYVEPNPFYGIRFDNSKKDEEIGYTNILKRCEICKKEITTRILGKIIN